MMYVYLPKMLSLIFLVDAMAYIAVDVKMVDQCISRLVPLEHI